jgi:hypothetical protein
METSKTFIDQKSLPEIPVFSPHNAYLLARETYLSVTPWVSFVRID